MHELLNYPFDTNLLMSKRRRIKRELLEQNTQWKDLRIAILGGSTTHDVKEILELFLLNQGIRPSFYESEYNKFYEDAVFGNDERILLVSRFDNLGKGASGAAIQNMNLALGCDEVEGLIHS